MREHEREYPRDDAFEALLAQSVDELPPEEIVADVTPWRRAMERVLFGLALCMVTLNFWCLNYLLPAIGTVLLLLGFRALRRENPWLRGCFVCAVLRAACVFPSLILNTTILPSDACRSAAAVVSAALMLTLLLCFWQGLRAVRRKAGLPAQGGGAGALLLIAGKFVPYVHKRIVSWRDPFADTSAAGYQIVQSLYSIGSGGFLGLGLGQSRQKYLYLPEEHNDYIFSIVCEELGYVGAVAILILFALLICRGYWIAAHSPDRYSFLVGVGITTLLSIQVFLNIAVVTNLIPCTGISLPFFSFGGTALIMLLAEMGVLLSVSRHSNTEKM